MTFCINPRCPNPQNHDDHLFCQTCGSELLLEGRYRVVKRRGKGGFGTTYEVSYRKDETKILKVLTDNLPKHVELFQREAFLLSQLHHPGIPAVEDGAYFTFYPKNATEPLHCIVMEKIVGLDLQDYLRQRGQPIDQRLALEWLVEVVEILHVLHQQHVLHRDIKPSNIMLKAEGSLALVDFGTARSVTNISGDPSEKLGTQVVSSFYTPPEQMRGLAVTRSDFFALGRTFVYLLTCTDLSVFYDSSTDTLNWRHAAPDLTPDFMAFLDGLMVPNIKERPATAIEILQQLKTLIAASSSAKVVSLQNAQTVFAPPQTSSSIPQAPEPTPAPPPPPPEPSSPLPLEEQFIQRCQRELAECIGPIATIICQQTLSQNPTASKQDFVTALVQHIANPQDAHRFRQRLL